MSKSTLIVCYSNTGTSRRVAELLASQFQWPCGEISEDRSRTGTIGMLRCVADSLLRRHPAIRYTGPDPRSFHTVVLIAPIWLYRLAGPMRSFVRDHSSILKRVAVISVMGGQGATNAFSEVDQILGHPPILSASFTAREVDDGSYSSGLEAFGRAVRDSGQKDEAVRPTDLSPSAV
ncbi:MULTISPECIES: flavodoxin [unclassified Polaromonas]|uniref:flavodoxin family protein n=1 Tax=unclassified Polaromonas TaxID=2638319 RepID=UPI000F07AE01|nr:MULTISPECIES: flavodoxin [unclassified Polaromonas]AYQ29487.1 flavodoxin [Polaromonas sp. SP1]QGJ19396.1 flavodoxin [Polaromonas sp. Pch-P]